MFDGTKRGLQISAGHHLQGTGTLFNNKKESVVKTKVIIGLNIVSHLHQSFQMNDHF